MKLRIFIPQLVNYLRKFKREEIYFELVKVDCFPFLYLMCVCVHICIYMSRAGKIGRASCRERVW